MLQLLKHNLLLAQNRMKQYADTNRNELKFVVGDMVYLRIKPYKQVTVAQLHYCKLRPKYYGPFQVLERVGQVAYKLQLPHEVKIHSVFYVSVLKKRVGNNDQVLQQLPPMDVHGQFIVEPFAILEH